MRRLIILLLLAATLIFVPPDPARACSCFPFDATETLAESEGAFIGRLLLRQESPPSPGEVAPDGIRENAFLYRFRVDETVKGSFPSEVDIRSGEGGGDCGINPTVGEPVGLLVDRWQGMLTSYLCSQITPDQLRRAAAPVPPPNGQPPPRLLVGTTYGGGRVLSLDGSGRVVAFGTGQGQATVLAVCPGAERVAEVFVPPESATTWDAAVAVRSVGGLVIERDVPLPGSGPAGGVYRAVEALTCRDSAALDLLAFVREESPDYQSRIIQVRGTDTITLWKGTATHGSFHPQGHLAYVTGGRQGTDLVAVDLRADPVTERPIATIPEYPGGLAIDQEGRVAAPAGGPLARGPNPGPLVIVTIDPSTGQVRKVSLPGESPSGTVVWASEGRLVFVPNEGWDPVRVYDEELTEVAVWSGWASSRALVAGDQLVGLDQGVVLRAPVQGGPVARFAELGDGLPGAIAVVPAADGTGRPGNLPAAGPTGAADTDPNEGDTGRTIAALAAVLLAGTVLAVYSASKGGGRT
jgi:hypothetical protein